MATYQEQISQTDKETAEINKERANTRVGQAGQPGQADKVGQAGQIGKLKESKTAQQMRAAEKHSPAFTVIVGGTSQNADKLSNFNLVDNLAIFFDSVENYTYSLPVKKTDFAVETGVTISDHAALKDRTISFTGRVTSAPLLSQVRKNSYIDRNLDRDNPMQSMRPAAAVQALEEIRKNRVLCDLITEDAGLLEGFILTKCDIRRDASQGDCIVIDCEFTEFRTFTIRTVEASVTADPKKVTKSKNKGIAQNATKESNVEDSAKRKVSAFERGEKSMETGKDYSYQKGQDWREIDGDLVNINSEQAKKAGIVGVAR